MIPLSKDDTVKIIINDVTYKFKAPVGDIEDLLLNMGTEIASEEKEITYKSIRIQNNEFISKILIDWSSAKHKLPVCSKENIMLLQFALSKKIASEYVEAYTTSIEELKNL